MAAACQTRRTTSTSPARTQQQQTRQNQPPERSLRQYAFEPPASDLRPKRFTSAHTTLHRSIGHCWRQLLSLPERSAHHLNTQQQQRKRTAACRLIHREKGVEIKMVPRGTASQQTATNHRSIRPISIMPDAVPPSKLPAVQPIASSMRLEPLAAAAQSKDWQKRRVPQPPPWVSYASGARTTRRLATAYRYETI